MSEEKTPFVFTGIKVEQPLGEFYIGKIEGRKLASMSMTDVRNMRDEIDQRIGIQRELNAGRVKEIREYVHTTDACFPNSVILSVEAKNIRDEIKEIAEGVYEIPLIESDDTFHIIDGQHRIAGLENYDDHKPFFVNVSLFLDMDIEQQAILFATINSKQKAVNKSLMMDLHTMQSARNPIKTAHYISRILNEKSDGALYHRITPFFTSPKNGGYKYTQANFISNVYKYISGNEIQLIKDRDALKSNKPLVYADEKARRKLIFRNMFIDESDEKIALLINNYFCAVDYVWHRAWNEDGYVLARTIGFNALMKVLPDVVSKIDVYDEVISIDRFVDILKSLEISEDEFNEDYFELTGYGQSDVVKLLRKGL